MKATLQALGVLVLVAFALAHAEAQASQPGIDPAAIVIQAVKDNSDASATFYVTARPGMQTMSFFATDLQDTTELAQQQPMLLASQVTFSPATLTDLSVDQRAQVRVSVSTINHAGSWKGSVIIQWTGDSAGELTLPLTVTMKNKPTIVAESPVQVVVAGVKNTEIGTRRITLHETSLGSPVTNIAVYTHDLTNDDLSRIISSTQIHTSITTPAPGQITGGGRGDVLVDLDLTGVQSGSYTGNLVIQSTNTDDLLIPMTVQVKDPASGAWFVLAIGVLLGVVLTWYRSTMMPKDQLRVGVDEVREYLQQHAEFGRYFGRTVESDLDLVADHLRLNRVPEATSVLEHVQALRTAWAQNQVAITSSIATIEALLAMVETSQDDFKDLEAVKQFRDQANHLLEQEIPDYIDKPNDLEDKLENATTGWRKIIPKLLALYENVRKSYQDLSAVKTNAIVIDANSMDQLKDLEAITHELQNFATIPDVPTLAAWEKRLADFHATFTRLSNEGAAAKQTYDTFHGKANNLLQDVHASEPHVDAALKKVSSQLIEASDAADDSFWIKAALLAQNSWQAAQALSLLAKSSSARNSQTTGAWEQVWNAEGALSQKLQMIAYDQELQAFSQDLEPSVTALRAALQQASPTLSLDVSAPNVESQAPTLGGDDAPRQVQALSPEPNLQVANRGPISTVQAWWQPWSTPQNRLRLLTAFTFVSGVGLLILVGYKELYQDVPTFGVEGIWDYFKLLLWGFGAEAGRAQVVGLVKDWGIAGPRPS